MSLYGFPRPLTSGGPTVLGPASGRPSLPVDRWALALVQRGLNGAPVRVALWDGTERPDPSSSGPPIGRVLVCDRAALYGLLWDPEFNFGRAYEAGRLQIEGSLAAMLEAVSRAGRDRSSSTLASWIASGLGWTVRDRDSARQNIHHHYDLGNDFYRLWLDDQLVYTCAYFPSPADTLEAAQVAKMHHVCRKLGLRPGERVLEAGCGWGALALFMARHYGVTVQAYNLSHEQIAYARDRARHEGIDDRVAFIEADYRDAAGRCDAFVSIGMVEHVGRSHYPDLSRTIDRTLDPRHGRGLLHFIGRNQRRPLNSWIRRRIFPGAYPPTLTEVTGRVLEPGGFSVLDVENLRLHYARTLALWLERFERSRDEVASMFDEGFVRAWRLYLAGSQAAFTTGWMQLFQITFARGTTNDVPWRRHA